MNKKEHQQFNESVFEARSEYLNNCVCPPEQFNIQKFSDGRWECEFMEEESCWYDCTLWLSGEKVIKVFFSCNPLSTLEDFDVGIDFWDEEWTTQN